MHGRFRRRASVGNPCRQAQLKRLRRVRRTYTTDTMKAATSCGSHQHKKYSSTADSIPFHLTCCGSMCVLNDQVITKPCFDGFAFIARCCRTIPFWRESSAKMAGTRRTSKADGQFSRTSDSRTDQCCCGSGREGSGPVVSGRLKNRSRKPGVVARGFQPRRSTVTWIGRRPNASASLQLHM